jgi:hypothetical protein
MSSVIAVAPASAPQTVPAPPTATITTYSKDCRTGKDPGAT